jgi:hypothetical protein
MDTEDQPTCGKGLAESSILPAKLGNLIAAMAGNLVVHMKALDLTDSNSQAEYNKPPSNCSGRQTKWLAIVTYPWGGMMKLQWLNLKSERPLKSL